MPKDFLTALKDRRTIYSISDKSAIPDEQIVALIKDAVKHVPSAFNSQSARVAVLFGDNHKRLWEIVMEILRKRISPDNFEQTEAKINGFSNGYGTILYFDDTNVTDEFANKFVSYKNNFEIWADQANGMLQFAIWSLLEAEGLGANLQHYNPIIDGEVRAAFDIPAGWRLIAQMPFGKPTASPDEKQFIPIDQRVLVI